MVKPKNKFITYYLIFFNVLSIVLLIVLLYGSMNYWWTNFPLTYDTNSRLFYAGVGLAVITIIAEWIQGRFKGILKLTKDLKGGNK